MSCKTISIEIIIGDLVKATSLYLEVFDMKGSRKRKSPHTKICHFNSKLDNTLNLQHIYACNLRLSV